MELCSRPAVLGLVVAVVATEMMARRWLYDRQVFVPMAWGGHVKSMREAIRLRHRATRPVLWCGCVLLFAWLHVLVAGHGAQSCVGRAWCLLHQAPACMVQSRAAWCQVLSRTTCSACVDALTLPVRHSGTHGGGHTTDSPKLSHLPWCNPAPAATLLARRLFTRCMAQRLADSASGGALQRSTTCFRGASTTSERGMQTPPAQRA
eukprot:309410-Chlamydomonas_euryale.AAC.6